MLLAPGAGTMNRPLSAGLLLMLLLLPLVASAQARDDCLQDCSGEISCVQETTEHLLQSDRGRDAIEYLKGCIREAPDQPAFAQLLSDVYRRSGNAFWAQKTLLRFLSLHEEDCTIRPWLAWVYIEEGDLDLAAEVLGEADCPSEEIDRARWALLQAYMSGIREDRTQQMAQWKEVGSARALYPEDRALWKTMRRKLQPGWIDPVTVRTELSLGYSSNVSAGLPTTEAGPDLGSPLVQLDLWSRLVPPVTWAVRPALEWGLIGRYVNDFDDDDDIDVRRASYLEVMVKPGVIIGTGLPRLLVSYRYDFYLLNQGDLYDEAPLIFYDGHRGDLELELDDAVTLLLGGGRRIFRQRGRSRWEVDGGAGWSLWPVDKLHLLLAVSLRYQSANNEEYDQFGGNALGLARLLLGRGFYSRIKVSTGGAYYANSPPEEGGRDLFIKPSVGFWSPARHGARIGVTYEFARRDSSAEVSYSYTEHRGLFQIRWNTTLDPWSPGAAAPRNHVPLNYGIRGDEEPGLEEERIQDLLRQDETARRGSSCVN
jgi:hypothetical protein